MTDYCNSAEVIQALASTTKRLEKEAILEDAWNSGLTDLFLGAQLAYDPLITFGVKKLPTKNINSSNKQTSSQDFFMLSDQLRERNITGNAALEAIQELADNSNEDDWNLFYSAVLKKDLRCGVSSKTVNKVLKKVSKVDSEAKDYLIRLFECQLATDSTKHPKNMSGEKMLDYKYDGVRLLTFVDFDKETVTQYTRNGKINENFQVLSNEFESIIKTLGNYLEILYPDEKVWIFDGEVVSDDFQKLMKQVNRKENIDTMDAVYWMFDFLPLSTFQRKNVGPQNKLTQKERYDLLSAIMHDSIISRRLKNSKFLESTFVDLDTQEGNDTYKAYMKEAIKQGLEGIMIKDPHALYECKRSKNWLKLKPVISVDLEVIDLEIGTGRNSERLGNLICEGYEDDIFIQVSVGSGFSDEQRDEFWDNRTELLGQIVEVKADCISQNQDGSYSLRFPRFDRFRGDVEHGKI